MATQNRNSNSSGSRKSTGSSGTKRSTGNSGSRGTPNGRSASSRGSSGGGGKKTGVGSDKLLNIFLVLLLITIIVLVILYFRKGAKEEGEPTPIPTQQVQPGGVTVPPEDLTGGAQEATPEPTDTLQPTPPEPTAIQPEPSPTESIEPTQSPEASLTPEPTPQVTAPAAEGIGTAQADEILADVFWEEGYRFTLSDSKFSLDGGTYYRYDVSYNGQVQAYDVLVGREDGELYYYEGGVFREFDGLPEHAEQPGDEDIPDGMTADAAAEMLKQFPYTSLGLPAELDECSLMLDNWKTVVQGQECYCLNVFYNGTLAGNIYFTEAAEHVYYLDEFGEFVRVR